VIRKRWNQKGSVHAKRRMGELRQRKLELLKTDLIREWECVTGSADRRGWWDAAQAAGLRPGCGTEASIQFLRGAIAAARSGKVPAHA
jgi:hypothetical protein